MIGVIIMVYIKCKREVKIFRYFLSYFVTVFVSLFFSLIITIFLYLPQQHQQQVVAQTIVTAMTTTTITITVAAPHSTTTLAPTHNFYLTYMSPTLGMKIDYPSSWQKVEGNVGVMFLSPQENDLDEIRGGLGILVFARSDNMSICMN